MAMTETDVSSYFAQFNPTQQQLKKLTSLVHKARKVWGHDYSNYGQSAAEEAMLVVAPGELSQLTPAAYRLLKRCEGRIWAFKAHLGQEYDSFCKQTYEELFDLLLSLGLIAEATPRHKLKGSRTVKQLRSLLEAKGLSVKGKKEVLVDRIVNHIAPAELDVLIAHVVLFHTTGAGDQAIRVIDELHQRMRFAFFEAVRGSLRHFETTEKSLPSLPPGVLYDDGDVRITEEDVRLAIAEWDERMPPEARGLLNARGAMPEEEAECVEKRHDDNAARARNGQSGDD
jgi:hypothetical protein